MIEITNGSEPDPTTAPVREWIDGTPPIAGSLAEIRTGMDALDTVILGAIIDRAGLAVGAALFKRDPGEVQAPARQEAVINQAVDHAKELAPDSPAVHQLVEDLWHVLVRGCVAMQQAEFPNTRLIDQGE